ncbi:MAG: Cytosol aminopeptidase [Alphaproteobacteria bacterium MarineAlpha9_Bin4]|nr:leucyl aminopeptidase [Pelagibacterales bacterium]PPR26850.1 MAG: Cytosol aminopeptidase [Alphaproteobacteria bacterium MarineAlpha9_Bin4]
MKINFNTSLNNDKGTLVFVHLKGKPIDKYLDNLNKKSKGYINKIIKVSSIEFNNSSYADVIVPKNSNADRIILIGVDLAKLKSEFEFGKLGSYITSVLNEKKIKDIKFIIPDFSKKGMYEANILYGMALNTYRFNKYFTENSKKRRNYLNTIAVVSKNHKLIKEHWLRYNAIKEGVFLTRNLVSEPANNLTPVLLAKEAKKLKNTGLKINVLDEKKLKALKMGALLGVAQGSANKPFVVTLEWRGRPKSKDTDFSFVGKGVTFDTGGISIKPSGGMEEMKYDMGGSAVVLGLMKSIALSKAKANISAVVGLVENMPSGTAQRPGDVVTSMSGKTIEVINTDAEGRLVLADVVWYAQKKFKPKNLVDLATLTGAIIVSIGQEKAGMFSNSTKLSNLLEKAGKEVGEPVWSMPIDNTYEKDIRSDIADMKNVGSGRGAGSTAGAIFVKRFIDNVNWIHLDIAGVTWAKSDKPLVPKGGTGYGVRLLEEMVLQYLKNE